MMSSSILLATLALVVLEAQTSSDSSSTLFHPTEKYHKEALGKNQEQTPLYHLNNTSQLILNSNIADKIDKMHVLRSKEENNRIVQEYFQKQVSNLKGDTGGNNEEIAGFHEIGEDSTLDYHKAKSIQIRQKQQNLETSLGDLHNLEKLHSYSLTETLFGLADLLSNLGVFSQSPVAHSVFQYFLMKTFDQLIWSNLASKEEAYQKRILQWEDADHPVRTLINLLGSTERKAFCSQTAESRQFAKKKIRTLLQGLDITLQEFMEVNIKSLLHFFHSDEIGQVEKAEASLNFLCRNSFKLKIQASKLCVKDLKKTLSSLSPVVGDEMHKQHKSKRQKRFLFFGNGRAKPNSEPHKSVRRSGYEDDSSYHDSHSSSYVVVTGGGDDIDKYLYGSSALSVGTIAVLALLCLKGFVYTHNGPPGEKGDGGLKGVKGYIGPAGYPGYHGHPGTKGFKGMKGLSGTTGSDGDSGTKGYKGDKGHPGIPGLPGEVGDLGIPGDAGPQGDDGPRGYRGERGDRGPPGYPAIYPLGEKRSLDDGPLVGNSFIMSSTSTDPEKLNAQNTSVNETATGREEIILHGKLFNLDKDGKEKIAIFSMPRMVVGPVINGRFFRENRKTHDDTTIVPSYNNITLDLSAQRGSKSETKQMTVENYTIDKFVVKKHPKKTRPERKRRTAEAPRSQPALYDGSNRIASGPPYPPSDRHDVRKRPKSPADGPPYPPSGRHGAWKLPTSPFDGLPHQPSDKHGLDTPVSRLLAPEDDPYRYARPGEEASVVTAINHLWREHNNIDGCGKCALFAFLDRQQSLDLDSYIIAGFSHILGASDSLQLLDDVREGKRRGSKMRCRRRKNTCDLEYD